MRDGYHPFLYTGHTGDTVQYLYNHLGMYDSRLACLRVNIKSSMSDRNRLTGEIRRLRQVFRIS